MEPTSNQLTLLKDIVDRISVGVFVVNKQNELVLWNGYMENYSQTSSEEVVGKNIFEAFPDLPKAWLEQKIHNVFVIKNFSFTSWEHRPYLFKFLHNRPITGGIDYMRQNCTFLPIKGESGDIEFVCVTLFDVTDTSIYESMLKNAVRSLAEASNRDGLTNVYNRRFLETSMAKEFSRIKRYGGTLTFIIIDLDHFKAVNDNHGHLAGDEILKVAAKRIAEGLRTADTLSRYGGEEFAVMLPETPIDGATILAQRLCDNLAATPVQFGDNSITVSASLGVAEFQADMESYEIMISRADDMLYRSKENGRNQVTVYYPDKELPSEDSTPKDEKIIDGEVAAKQDENLAANIIEPIIEANSELVDTADKTEQEEAAPIATNESENSESVETEATEYAEIDSTKEASSAEEEIPQTTLAETTKAIETEQTQALDIEPVATTEAVSFAPAETEAPELVKIDIEEAPQAPPVGTVQTEQTAAIETTSAATAKAEYSAPVETETVEHINFEQTPEVKTAETASLEEKADNLTTIPTESDENIEAVTEITNQTIETSNKSNPEVEPAPNDVIDQAHQDTSPPEEVEQMNEVVDINQANSGEPTEETNKEVAVTEREVVTTEDEDNKTIFVTVGGK